MNGLNRMCLDCTERGQSCEGTTCQTWTGCIYRKAKTSHQSSVIPIMSRSDLEEKGVLISALKAVARAECAGQSGRKEHTQ